MINYQSTIGDDIPWINKPPVMIYQPWVNKSATMIDHDIIIDWLITIDHPSICINKLSMMIHQWLMINYQATTSDDQPWIYKASMINHQHIEHSMEWAKTGTLCTTPQGEEKVNRERRLGERWIYREARERRVCILPISFVLVLKSIQL